MTHSSRILNILVACEESQAICSEFRKLGHRAFSSDLQTCSGGRPEWHIVGDCIPLLDGSCSFITEAGTKELQDGTWDLIIAHPPCTYLTATGNRWFNVDKYGSKAIERLQNREEAVDFFMKFVHAQCKYIAVENPVGCMSTRYRKPDQIIQPYMFGDPFEKKTCLWLKNLIKLHPVNAVEPPPRKAFKSGKTMPQWYADCWKLPKEERARLRSKTFPGIASAIAQQWSQYILNNGG